jgi:hypothetical protein
MKEELAQLKLTPLHIREWDGFQLALREIMKRSNRRSQ